MMDAVLCSKAVFLSVLVFFLFFFFVRVWSFSLGPVVNIFAIFSNANILKNKRIKIGCPLLISTNIVILTKERKNKKGEKNDQTGAQASGHVRARVFVCVCSVVRVCTAVGVPVTLYLFASLPLGA